VDPITLCATLCAFLPLQIIAARDRWLGGSQRQRKRDVLSLVVALVMTPGSDDSGRQADIFTTYLSIAPHAVVRSSFYAWFTEPFALLMMTLLDDAIAEVKASEPILDGALAGWKDWRAVDSETITLRPALRWIFPAAKGAGIKVHKVFSIGRNNIIDYRISPAVEHDSPHLQIDETWRGYGLLIDLGYASTDRIRRCKRHGVGLVMRLKSGWKPRLLKMVRDSGEVLYFEGEPVCETLLDLPSGPGSRPYDFDIAIGSGSSRVEARLVGVPSSTGYHWCITLLPREQYSPALVCQIYRARWEIECDNRREKGAARLDHIGALKPETVFALVFGSLLRNLITNHLVYLDLVARQPRQAPLHGFALSLALCTVAHLVVSALVRGGESVWTRLCGVLRARGQDPNWRSRPSQLDILRRTVAPPGRPRRTPLHLCSPEARSYRRPAPPGNRKKQAA